MWGLQELPYPEAYPLLPETTCWLVLAGLLLLAGSWQCWRVWRRWQQNGYRREALTQLRSLSNDEAYRLPFIMRKTALAAFDRTTVASLRSTAWIRWLNDRADQTLFEPEDAELLDQLAYSNAPLPAAEFSRLISASRGWVTRHHV